MSEPIKLDLPAINFFGDNEMAAIQAKRSYDLHARIGRGGITPYGRKLLPDEILFTHIQWSLQAPWDMPANMRGRVAVFIDRRDAYGEEVDYPTQENGHPRGLLPLGYANLAPGGLPFIRVDPCVLGPTPYRCGDRLGVAVETNDTNVSQLFEVFASPIFQGNDGDWLAYEEGAVWAVPLNGSYVGSHPVGYRSLVPAIRCGGTGVVVHFNTGADGMVINRASVGVALGDGPHMAGPPVPLLFGGSASVALPPYADVNCDVAALETAAGQALIVHIEFGGAFSFKGASKYGRSWYTTTAGGHATAVMPGVPMQDYGVLKRTYGFDAVWVL